MIGKIKERGGLGLNPLAKLILLVAYSILVLLVTNLIVMVALLATVIGAVILFEARSTVTKGIVGFAIAIFVAQLLFNHSGETLARILVVSIHSGGVVSGFLIAGKFLSLIGMSWVYVATTIPARLSNALTTMGVPYRLAFLPAISLRFVPVFRLEYGTVREAQTTRGLRLEHNVRGLLRSAKYTITPMLVSAMSKVNSLAASMTGRGFGAFPTRTMMDPQSITTRDVATVAAGIAVAIFAFWLNFHLPVTWSG